MKRESHSGEVKRKEIFNLIDGLLTRMGISVPDKAKIWAQVEHFRTVRRVETRRLHTANGNLKA